MVIETVLITPRPFMTILALPVRINPIARRVLHTLMGAKLAFKTKTDSFIAPRILQIIARDLKFHTLIQQAQKRVPA
jgi:hypothetical protein